MYTKKFLFLVL